MNMDSIRSNTVPGTGLPNVITLKMQLKLKASKGEAYISHLDISPVMHQTTKGLHSALGMLGTLMPTYCEHSYSTPECIHHAGTHPQWLRHTESDVQEAVHGADHSGIPECIGCPAGALWGKAVGVLY